MTRTQATLTSVEPQIFVLNMAIAMDYYQQLGFDVVFTYGDPIFYAQVKRDSVALNLRLIHAPVWEQKLREQEALLTASICDCTCSLS